MHLEEMQRNGRRNECKMRSGRSFLILWYDFSSASLALQYTLYVCVCGCVPSQRFAFLQTRRGLGTCALHHMLCSLALVAAHPAGAAGDGSLIRLLVSAQVHIQDMSMLSDILALFVCAWHPSCVQCAPPPDACCGNTHPSFALQAAAYGSDSDLVLFTGEMVFPWMFEDLAGLRPMKALAELLAQRTEWSKLYDSQQLQRNEVPVVAATYVEDMYVDFTLAQATAAKIKGVRQWMTNEYQHSVLPADSLLVLHSSRCCLSVT